MKLTARKLREEPALGENLMRLLAHPERTGNKHCQAVLLRILPGHRFPKHEHPDSDDVIYVLRGKVKFWVGEEAGEAEAGDVLIVPEGVAHSVLNSTSEDVELLVFQAPVPKFKLLE